MNHNIKKWIIDWFKNNTANFPDEINDEIETKSYFEEAWIDSLQFISFIAALEDEFKINFSNDDFQNRDFSTLAGLSKIVSGYLKI